MKNISAYLEKYNSNLKFFEYETPNLSKGQVLVRIKYAGICRSQLMEIEGKRDTKKWLPHMLGHEAVGKVIGLHKTCKKFKIGDDIIATWINSKGSKSRGGEVNFKKKRINYGPISTFSKFAIISENKLVKKPKNLNDKIAPYFGCAALTGMGLVLNQAKPKKNDLVLVLGLGGVGLFSIFALLTYRNIKKKIVIFETKKKKKKLAKKLGIQNFYLISRKSDKEKLIKNFRGKVNLCLENSGSHKSIEFAMSMIKDNGKVYFSSHPPQNKKIKINPHDLIKGKKIFGTWGGGCKPDRDISRFSKILKNNKLFIDLIKSKHYDFVKINNAIKDFKNGKILRPIIKI